MNSEYNQSKLLTIEEEVINEIASGYFECRDFFSTYTNKDYEIYTKKKKNFLLSLCMRFHEKFGDFSFLYPVDKSYILKTMKKSYFIPLIVKNGGFEYPKSFVVYFDLIKDINVASVKLPDFTSIDSYFKNFKISEGLNEFFKGFFSRLKKITIPLRKREVDVLKLISDPNFLKIKSDGGFHISPISDRHILEGLSLSNKNLKKIERATTLLLNYKICWYTGVIVNASKFGFYYVLIDSSFPFNDELKPFLFWDIKFSHNEYRILCIPFDSTEELLQGIDYIPLTNWSWNSNMNAFDNKKIDTWENFKTPTLQTASLESSNYVNWDLMSPLQRKYKPWEIHVIKTLSRTSNLSLYSLEELFPDIHVNAIMKFLEEFVEKNVFQYYNSINFIGLDFRIGVRFSIDNKDLFSNFKNSLIMYPIAHLFTNEEEKQGLGFIHIPRNAVSYFLEQIDEFKEKNPDAEIELTFNNFNLLNRSLNLTNFNLDIENGIARYIKN
ncbi:MAG: hypothetical protein HeimC3_34380 [Candidatus Heimdallarchaeota archaeon LC_3]|nr:MAG: hypothetical protein HeimC3_34380 [Candidatus Heimdallarchaeota archaeon LC_3]